MNLPTGIPTHGRAGKRLRAFRDQLALEDSAADPKALDNLDRASTERLTPNPPKDGLGDSP